VIVQMVLLSCCVEKQGYYDSGEESIIALICDITWTGGKKEYEARHSWASIAQDRKVSTDIIREGLGHDNEKTTHIYLASISTSQIDRANQIILRGL